MRLSGAPGRLLATLSDRCGSEPTVREIHSRPWASATSSGVRHRIVLQFDKRTSEDAVDHLAKGLEDAEFDIGPDLLVDIAIGERHQEPEGTSITITALTIEAD